MGIKIIRLLYWLMFFSFILSCESIQNPILKLYTEKDYEGVIQHLANNQVIDSSNYHLLFALADSYYNLEKYDSSRKYFLIAKELNNEDKILFFKLGKSEYWTTGTGFSWFTVALSIDDTFEDAWYYWGLSLVESGNYKDAIEGFNKTLELNPNHDHCYQQLSLCYYMLEKPLDALKAIDKAIEMKDSSYYFYQKAVITDYLGLYSESLVLCDSSLVRDSFHVQSMALKAQNLINLNSFEEGCQWAEKVKQIAPEKDMSKYSQFCD